MVQLEEVEDETFETKQVGPSDNEDDFYTDTDSEISSDEEDDDSPISETLGDRIYALRDIIPASTRNSISSTVSSTTSWLQWGLLMGGKTAWVLTTTVMVFGVPWAVAFSDEQQMIEMENEMKMREMGGEMLTSGESQPAL